MTLKTRDVVTLVAAAGVIVVARKAAMPAGRNMGMSAAQTTMALTLLGGATVQCVRLAQQKR